MFLRLFSSAKWSLKDVFLEKIFEKILEKYTKVNKLNNKVHN